MRKYFHTKETPLAGTTICIRSPGSFLFLDPTAESVIWAVADAVGGAGGGTGMTESTSLGATAEMGVAVSIVQRFGEIVGWG